MIPGSVDPGVLALVYVSLHLGNSFAAIHDGLTSNTMQADIGYSYHEFGSYSSINCRHWLQLPRVWIILLYYLLPTDRLYGTHNSGLSGSMARLSPCGRIALYWLGYFAVKGKPNRSIILSEYSS